MSAPAGIAGVDRLAHLRAGDGGADGQPGVLAAAATRRAACLQRGDRRSHGPGPFRHRCLSRPPGAAPEHTAVAAAGTYLSGAEVRIGNRSSGGQPGFWLATPLELDDGRAVAVVRGWVPRRSLTGLDDRTTAPPAGEVTVAGLAFDSVEGGKVAQTAPGETPEISRMDLDRFEEVSGVDVEGVWIRLQAQSPAQPERLPEPVPDPDLGEGPHLSYAFQWFFFSAGAVVVYGLILRRAVAGRQEAPATELQL